MPRFARLAILCVTVAAPAFAEPAPSPPAGLACLARWYSVTPEREGDAWFARLPDGTRVPWDDGKAKTFDEKLDAPDLEDWFSIRYRKGPIGPVSTENDDPGRIRVDALFRATYPRSGLTKVALVDGEHTVHAKVKDAFARVTARLERALAADPSLGPFLHRLGGTFVPRNIAGTHRPSAHSYGVSVDINDQMTEYWRWQRPASPIRWRNRTPQAIVDAFEAEGFIWGGRWYHYDTMHFEYRPELLDESCYGQEKR